MGGPMSQLVMCLLGGRVFESQQKKTPDLLNNKPVFTSLELENNFQFQCNKISPNIANSY